MILTADYHTHTPYSHGKSTVLENAERAKALGLKQIGITDHGFGHLAFGLKRRKMAALTAECKRAEELTGVRVLVGVEANILGISGKTDVKESDYQTLDLFVCGKHQLVGYENLKAWWRYFGGNFVVAKFHAKPSEKLVQYNTEAYIQTIKKNPVDIISHLGYLAPANALEVAKCAADFGTYIELNSKKQHLSDDELCEIVAKTNARFVINSDAHHQKRVGDMQIPALQIQRVGVPLDRIDNVDGKLPCFRFEEYKKRR